VLRPPLPELLADAAIICGTVSSHGGLCDSLDASVRLRCADRWIGRLWRAVLAGSMRAAVPAVPLDVASAEGAATSTRTLIAAIDEWKVSFRHTIASCTARRRDCAEALAIDLIMRAPPSARGRRAMIDRLVIRQIRPWDFFFFFFFSQKTCFWLHLHSFA
jgi:hypothetical protein